jgi:hypothetical protein
LASFYLGAAILAMAIRKDSSLSERLMGLWRTSLTAPVSFF